MRQNKFPTPSHIQAVMDIWSESGERTKLRVEGRCMSPIIKDGNAVHLVHRCKEIRVGDVVLYGEPDSYKLHRIVRLDKKKNVCLLKGDNSPEMDPPVRYSMILAKVVAVEDKGRIIDFDAWWWRLINPVLAHFSYFEVRVRERKSIFNHVIYLLGIVMWHPIKRLLRPNYLAGRLFALSEVKDGISTDTERRR